MEEVKGLEKKKLMNELTQGKEFVKQLKKQIGPLASPEECDLLIGKILCTLEKSLSILNLKALLLEGGINNTNNSTSSSSSISFLGNNNSSKSEVLDSSRDQLNKSMVSKKRKTSQQWTNQTSIFVNGLEGPQDDGYSWRKYGQKDILGANHPRAYYRCTHRNTQGCLATKLVQKSDGNSTMFEVTYKGRHSCKVAQSEIFSLDNQKRHKRKTKQEQDMVIFNSEPNHKVENVSITTKEVFTPFPFPPTPLQLENIEETEFFSDSMAPFSSPIAPELPSYLSMLTSQNEEFAMEHMILQSSDSDLTELISTPTSISNSSFGGDCDLSVDFEPNDTFDIEEFFK